MAKYLWTQKEDFGPSARVGHAMAFDSNRNRAVLFGGDTFNNALLADTWEWNGDFWTQTADIGPSGRRDHALCFDDQRKVTLLFGGASGRDPAGDTWGWDGADWTQLEDTGPAPRSSHAMVFDSSRGRAVLFGGDSGASVLNDTWEWDGQNWTQQEDTGPSRRRNHAMAYDVRRQRVVLFGGDGGDGQGLGDTWEWDGTAWSQLSNFGASPCLRAAMISTEAEVALFGGISGVVPEAAASVYRDTWTFDGKLWTHRQDIGPGPRWSHALAYDSNRRQIVLFGGIGTPPAAAEGAAPGRPLGDTWEHADTNGSGASSTTGTTTNGQVTPSPVIAVSLAPATAAAGQPVIATVTLNSAAPAGGEQIWLGFVRQSIFQAALQNPNADISGSIQLLTQFSIAGGSAIGQTQFSAPPSPEPVVVLAAGPDGVISTAVLTITA